MLTSKHKAATDFPIHDFLAERWSADAFDGRPVDREDLLSLFEAARWAASSYNEQPWSYIVALRDDAVEFEKILSCLWEGNQAWAKSAPVLALAVVNTKLARNGKENRAAVHDLGLASANLVFEATSRGLVVHQMAGIVPEKAKALYHVPDDCEVWTALAIGYPGTEQPQTELKPRRRKKLKEFIFSGNWGKSSPLVS